MKADIRSVYRFFVHPLLSLGIPFLFLSSLGIVFHQLTGGIFGPGFFFYMALFLTGLLQVSLGNIIQGERASGYARLRELLAILVIVYLGMIISDWLDKPGVGTGWVYIRLNLLRFFGMVIVVFQWLLSFILQKNFRSREDFLGTIKRKSGDELKEIVRTSGRYAQDIISSLKINKAMCRTVILLEFLLLAFCIIFRIQLSLWHVMVFFFSVAMNTISISLIHMFYYDLEIYGSGVNISSEFQKRKNSVVLLTIILLGGGAFFIASDRSILSPRLVLMLLAWLRDMFPRHKVLDSRITDALRRNIPSPPPQILTPGRLPETPTIFPLGDILDFLAKLAGIAVVIGLIGFLLYPLFTGEGGRFFRKIKFMQQVRKYFYGVLKFFIDLWRGMFIRSGKKVVAVCSSGKRSRESRLTGHSPGIFTRIRKGMERHQVVRGYKKVMNLGRQKGQAWNGEAPMEYLTRLMQILPEKMEALNRFGEIFEEALFSQHVLNIRTMGEYNQALQRILKR